MDTVPEQRPPVPTQKRCNTCHEALPLAAFHHNGVSMDGHVNKCKACAKAYMAVYRWENSQAIALTARSYRQRHKERRSAQFKEWVEHNRDYVHTWKRAYYEANADRIRQKARDYYASHSEQEREASREWFRVNRNKIREYRSRRQEREKGAPGILRAADVTLILAVQNSRCIYCGCVLDGAFHMDHLTPITRGGANSVENRAATCARCNNRKRTLTAGEFFARLIKERRQAVRDVRHTARRHQGLPPGRE